MDHIFAFQLVSNISKIICMTTALFHIMSDQLFWVGNMYIFTFLNTHPSCIETQCVISNGVWHVVLFVNDTCCFCAICIVNQCIVSFDIYRYWHISTYGYKNQPFSIQFHIYAYNMQLLCVSSLVWWTRLIAYCCASVDSTCDHNSVTSTWSRILTPASRFQSHRKIYCICRNNASFQCFFRSWGYKHIMINLKHMLIDMRLHHNVHS